MQETGNVISHKEIRKILEDWGLENEEITCIYSQLTGNKLENVVAIGRSMVLKKMRNLETTQNHMILSKTLEAAGLEAAAPIATKTGEEYVAIGETYFMLTKRVKGQQVRIEEMYGEGYKEKARYMGEVIGQLHKALASLDEIQCKEKNLFETVKNWAMPKSIEAIGLSDAFCKEYVEVFGTLYAKLPKQMIHRDLNLGNVILNEGKLSGFIDFELSEKNIRLFDPCYAATAILSESFGIEVRRNQWLEVYKNIMAGYDDVMQLTKEEKLALPYVIFSIQLICIAYFSENDKLSALNETNKEMFKWLEVIFNETIF